MLPLDRFADRWEVVIEWVGSEDGCRIDGGNAVLVVVFLFLSDGDGAMNGCDVSGLIRGAKEPSSSPSVEPSGLSSAPRSVKNVSSF